MTLVTELNPTLNNEKKREKIYILKRKDEPPF